MVVQHGPSRLRPRGATCVDYVSFARLVELVRQARVVVSHGGVGSILVALINDKHPLVVPRLARLGEVVDDHQLELSRKLDEAGLVTLVEDVGRLPELVDPTLSRSSGSNGDSASALVDDLRGYLATTLAEHRRNGSGALLRSRHR